MTDVTPTRSALLELQDERRAMREGYAFLDEKRLLLAAEMLRQLAHYEALSAEMLRQRSVACAALRAAIARHGLEGLECYPAVPLERAYLDRAPRALLGVPVQRAELKSPEVAAVQAVHPSPEAELCRREFAVLLVQAAGLAAVRGNLERLRREYRRTERRARALEDVLLPELDHKLANLDMSLEDLEREEALRARAGR